VKQEPCLADPPPSDRLYRLENSFSKQKKENKNKQNKKGETNESFAFSSQILVPLLLYQPGLSDAPVASSPFVRKQKKANNNKKQKKNKNKKKQKKQKVILEVLPPELLLPNLAGRPFAVCDSSNLFFFVKISHFTATTWFPTRGS
jgi:hypothetical protein